MRDSNLLNKKIRDEATSRFSEFKVQNEVIKEDFESMLNLLLDRITNHYGAIQAKVYGQTKGSLKIYSNFTFTYASFTVKPSGKSHLNIKLKATALKEWDRTFLTRNIKPKFGYVYFLKSKHGYKIGKTKNIKKRMDVFGVKLPFEVKLKYLIKTSYWDVLEKDLHKKFESKKINGEWFDISEKDIENISHKEFNYEFSIIKK